MQRTDGQRGTLRNRVSSYVEGALTHLAEVAVAALAKIAQDAGTCLAKVAVAPFAKIAQDAGTSRATVAVAPLAKIAEDAVASRAKVAVTPLAKIAENAVTSLVECAVTSSDRVPGLSTLRGGHAEVPHPHSHPITARSGNRAVSVAVLQVVRTGTRRQQDTSACLTSEVGVRIDFH